jgi:hypothetical protein
MSAEQSLKHAIFQRFLPASSAFLLTILGASAWTNPTGLSWAALGVASLEITLMAVGFGTCLRLARSTLQSDTRLGVRSALAGLAAPFVLGALSVFTQGASLPSISVLSLGAGTLTGLVTVGSVMLRRKAAPPMDPEVQAELERLEAELALPGTPVDVSPSAIRAPHIEPVRPAPVSDRRTPLA